MTEPVRVGDWVRVQRTLYTDEQRLQDQEGRVVRVVAGDYPYTVELPDGRHVALRASEAVLLRRGGGAEPGGRARPVRRRGAPPDEGLRPLADAATAYVVVQQALDASERTWRTLIKDASGRGFSADDIAAAAGVTPARVERILNDRSVAPARRRVPRPPEASD
jgi:hypothetical protein